MSRARAVSPPAQSVRTLELFFDLVFVFAITQVASVLTATPTLVGFARVAALLGVLWWMYGGYVWLTNALDLAATGPKLLLLLGMAGFFVFSLAVPRSFETGPWGLVLGLSYLLIVAVHTAGFLRTSGRAGILRIGPTNLFSALVVVAAGLVPPTARLWLLLAAVALQFLSPFLVGLGGFVVGAGHFVERHGLALIILLGESIIAVGTAATDAADLGVVLPGSLLALVLSASLWWLYFDREAPDAERLLDARPVERRGRAALNAFGYAYYVIVVAVTVTAVGMKKAITYFTEPLHDGPLWIMPLGLCGYLLGLALFHGALLPGRAWPLLAGAGASLLVVPAGLLVGGWLALTVAAVVLLATVIAHGRHRAAAAV